MSPNFACLYIKTSPCTAPVRRVHAYITLYIYRVSQKLVYLVSHQNSFLQFLRKYDFLEKLFNMKIFSIRFVIKKGYINFWCKMTPFPKRCSCPPKIFFYHKNYLLTHSIIVYYINFLGSINSWVFFGWKLGFVLSPPWEIPPLCSFPPWLLSNHESEAPLGWLAGYSTSLSLFLSPCRPRLLMCATFRIRYLLPM